MPPAYTRSPGGGIAQKGGFGLIYCMFNTLNLTMLFILLTFEAKPPEGEGTEKLPNGIVHGDQLCTIGKCALHLDLSDHLGYPLHHVVARQNGGTVPHQIGD